MIYIILLLLLRTDSVQKEYGANVQGRLRWIVQHFAVSPFRDAFSRPGFIIIL